MSGAISILESCNSSADLRTRIEQNVEETKWTAKGADFPEALKSFVKEACGRVFLTKISTARRSQKARKLIGNFEDCKCLFLEEALKQVQSHLGEKEQNADPMFCENAFELVRRLKTPVELARKFSCRYMNASCSIKKRMKYNRMKRVYTEVWTALTKIPLGTKTHRRLLLWLPEHVLDNAANPVLFVDYFFRSFEIGDPYDILALNGLFKLIHQHNLEYPEFFTRVYSLVQPQVLYAENYRENFFKLLDLFLSSTHLPAYLVAAFCKKFSRLLLVAPLECCSPLLDLIRNLIVRHSAVKKLLENKCLEDITDDPFNFDEPDPNKSNAFSSSLWEVKTLESHWFPDIARKSSFLLRELPKIENIVNWSDSQQLWEREISKKVEDKEMTVTFIPPKKLFSSEVLDFDSCFEL